VRVHELAKELEVTSKELLATLEHMGVSGKSASSSVPEDLVPRLRASGGKATEAPKRREVLEPPPAPRKPKKPAAKKQPAAAETPPAEPAATTQPAAELAAEEPAAAQPGSPAAEAPARRQPRRPPRFPQQARGVHLAWRGPRPNRRFRRFVSSEAPPPRTSLSASAGVRPTW
jgi:translation initiation factor IF-2